MNSFKWIFIVHILNLKIVFYISRKLSVQYRFNNSLGHYLCLIRVLFLFSSTACDCTFPAVRPTSPTVLFRPPVPPFFRMSILYLSNLVRLFICVHLLGLCRYSLYLFEQHNFRLCQLHVYMWITNLSQYFREILDISLYVELYFNFSS